MDLVSHFEASSTGITLEMSFDLSPSDDQQVGVVAFKLSGRYPVDPSLLEIEASSSGPIEVSLEIDDGEAGCLYETIEYDGIYVPYASVICWGGFEHDSLVEQINVRLAGYGSTSESMTIRGVYF